MSIAGVSVSDLWRLYTCDDPAFIDLVQLTVDTKLQELVRIRNG